MTYFVQITPTNIIVRSSPPPYMNTEQLRQFTREFKHKAMAISVANEISRETKRDLILFPKVNRE